MWTEILAGVGGLGSLLAGNSAAKAQKNASNAQAGLLNRQSQAFDQYGMPGMRELWNEYQNPDTTQYRTAMAGAEAGTARDFDANSRLVSQALRQRGLGGSSFEGSAIGQLGAARGETLARERVGQVNALQARRQQALSQLLGYSTGMGQSAAAGYGQMANMYGQQAEGAYGDLGNIAAMYFGNQYAGARPPVNKYAGLREKLQAAGVVI